MRMSAGKKLSLTFKNLRSIIFFLGIHVVHGKETSFLYDAKVFELVSLTENLLLYPRGQLRIAGLPIRLPECSKEKKVVTKPTFVTEVDHY